VTFFFDNHLPPIFAQILRAQGIDAIHLRERFPVGVEDVEWISEAGRQRWVAIAVSSLRAGAQHRVSIIRQRAGAWPDY
jgi:predicted nuclease of predicted toxin-antitoxin system